MQIAGTTCGACGTKIILEEAARGCVLCLGTYHGGCLEDPETCPACGVSFAASAGARRESEQKTSQRKLRNGRVIALVVSAFFLWASVSKLGLGLIALAGQPFACEFDGGPCGGFDWDPGDRGPPDVPDEGLARVLLLVFDALLSAALLAGHWGVRGVLKTLSATGSVAHVLVAWMAMREGDSSLAGVHVLTALGYGGAFWALALSPSVESFLDRHLRPEVG